MGTNNVEHTAEEISQGIFEIVSTIREKHPNAYIVIPVSILILCKLTTLVLNIMQFKN